MIVENPAKTSALKLLSLKSGPLDSPEANQLRERQLNDILKQLDFDESCQVELRFNDLRFDLVSKLQLDELVDRDLTPQTKASICIVLGTLAKFAVMANK